MLSDRSDIDPDQIFSPFDLTRRGALVAAVSGGSDSLAMLLLLQRRLQQSARRSGLLAVTVNHGLRKEAHAEAETVAGFCAARGIPHRIVTWRAEKPQAGIAAAARLARYELLAEAAASVDADIIVTGHTADDQAETVAMRQARGEGRGLAGMAPATLFDGRTWIIRPLLGLRRERLRQLLREEGVGWIDDPTNRDTSYERVRTRRELQLSASEGGQVEALLEAAARAGELRMTIGGRAAALVAAHAERPMPGLVRLMPDFVQAADEEAAVLALRALLAVVGGVEQLPEAGRVAALLGGLREGRVRATLSRTVVDARKAGVYLYRERRGLPEGRTAPAAFWDRRYEIVDKGEGFSSSSPESRRFPPHPAAPRPPSPRWGEEGTGTAAEFPPLSGRGRERSERVRGVAHSRHSVRNTQSEDRRGQPPARSEPIPHAAVPSGIASAVRATMPQAHGASLVAVPILAPWRRFLPSFDLVLAGAIARLIAAGEIPPPPFAGHNGKEA